MAETPPPAAPPAAPAAPAAGGDDAAQKAKFVEWFDEAMTGWATKNKPAPARTSGSLKAGDMFGFLFGKSS